MKGQGINELKQLPEATVVDITACRNTGYSTPVEKERNLTRNEAIKYIQDSRELRGGLIYKFSTVTKKEELLLKVNAIQNEEFKLRKQIAELEAKIKQNANIRTQIIADVMDVKIGDEFEKGTKRFLIKTLESTFDDIMGDAILLQGECAELKADGTVNKKVRQDIQTIKVIKNDFKFVV